MKPELLAPCGSISALKQAVYNGADAVYLGLQSFNARIKADNFTTDNIADIVKFCHIYGVKTYITVNTAVKNNEINEVKALILACKNANINAFIISDLAVCDIIRKVSPEIPMHASTQMGVCNLESAKFIEKLGFTRVVLARETTYKDIINISQNTKLELEYFIHGALCVAFSGKCLFSSMVSGNSGNRGRCLQPCRLKYKTENSEGYLLSTSDLCLANHLKELVDAGISSFKIEGRLRRESYVRDTVKVYRKIIDNNFMFTENDLNILKSAYNRGNFSAGYAFAQNTNEIMSTKIQSNIGIFAGKIFEVFKKNNKNYVKIATDINIKEGDGYKLIDDDGFEVTGGRINSIDIKKGFYIIQIDKAKKGYSLNITSTQDNECIEKKLPVNIFFAIDENNFANIKIEYNNIVSKIKSEKQFEVAKNTKLTENEIKRQLSKLGNTYFILNNFNCDIKSNVFIPVSDLNNLRRLAVAELEYKILNNYNKSKQQTKLPEYSKSIIQNKLIHNTLIAIELQTIEQLSNYVANNADYIVYYPFEFNLNNIKKFIKTAKEYNKNAKIYLKLTPNANYKDIAVYRDILNNISSDIFGIYADNYYSIELANEYNLKVFGGLLLNIFNTKTIEYINFDEYTVSAELTASEVNAFKSHFVFAYGYLPLMNFTHCVQKLNYNSSCGNCSYKDKITYTDRKGYNFDIFRNKVNSCYFTLYNSIVTDISLKINDFAYNFYLNMLQCDSKKIENIIKAFINKQSLKNDKFTYGHLLRGVE